MAGGSSNIIGGGGGGAIEGPPEASGTPAIADSLRYCPTNSSTEIFHNGITWTFTDKVTWGTYVSGDPWVLVTGAGITVSSIEPGLTLVSGTVGTPAGVTFWINATTKNQKPLNQAGFYSVYTNWYGITWINYNNSNCDQRTSSTQFTVSTIGSGFSYSELSLLPIGLTSGDVLISNYSSFDRRNDVFNTNTIRYTETSFSGLRSCLESKAVLTAVSSIPECDEYRPPVYWREGQFKNRPSFKESEFVNNPQNYVIQISELKDLFGYTLSQPIQSNTGITYSGLVNDWNTSLEDSMVSSLIPMWFNTKYQAITDLRSTYGFANRQSTYGTRIRKYGLERHFYSIFAPWVPANLRLKALRKILQYSIDVYGYFKAGSRTQENGGHLSSVFNPYVRFLGWVFNNSSILNYEKSGISFSEDYVNTKMTSGGTSPKGIVNLDRIHKSLFLDEYMMHHFVYGLGETGAGKTAFIATNPNVGITHNFGLSGSGQNIFAANGATGIGWLYKYAGVTLDSTTPYSTASTVSIEHVRGMYGLSGQFGVLNLSSTFKPRNTNTLPSSASRLGKLNYDENKNYTGLIVKIVGGSGAGNTEYRTLAADGFDKQNAGTTYYCKLYLDRPFQDGVPSSTSVVNIYPYSATDNYPLNCGLQECIFDRGITAENFANAPQMGYSSMSYADTFLPSNFIAYSVLKHLGITQDNEILNYFYNLYFTNKYPTHAKHRQLVSGSYGFGFDTQFSENNLTSMLLKNMWGASGAYLGIVTNQTAGISGTSYPPLLSTVINTDLSSYTYTVSGVSYETNTGEILEGLGVVYDSPVTPYFIKAIIGNNIVIDTSAYSFIDYAEFTDLFGYPSLFINGNKARLLLNTNVIVDGVIPFIYEDDVTPASLDTQVSYVLTNGYSHTQHSLQTTVPNVGISGASYVTSTLPINQMMRRRNILTFNINPIGVTSDFYDADQAVGVTFSDVVDVSIQGNFGYINIGGDSNSINDWTEVQIDKSMNTYSIDISNVTNSDLTGVPLTLRFFTNAINVFDYQIEDTVKYRQNENVYSRF